MQIAKSKKRFISLATAIVSALAIIALIIFAVSKLQKSAELSDFEKTSFEKETKPILDYLDAIDSDTTSDEPGQLDKYVAFALLYSANEQDKNQLTFDEIRDIIRQYFDIDTNARPIETLGITPVLADYHISGGRDTGSFTIDISSDQKTIARTPIVKYILTDVKKSGDNFIANYDKYIAEDPYKIFNFANDNHIDTPGAGAYLKGEGKAASLKNIITPENAERLATLSKHLTITYETTSSGLRVKEMH